MPPISETGHAINVAKFQNLIQFIAAYDATYNPTKNSLKLPQLLALKTDANQILATAIYQNTNYNNTINERNVAFKDLKKLATRLINALQSTEATQETISNAKSFNRKLQGKKAKSAQPTTTTISTSQLSFDHRIQHLAGFNAVLDSEPTYAPNETDLQVATITTKIANLTAHNAAVATAHASNSNAKIARNQILYATTSGLVDIANATKKYIKSVYGATSPQFAQIGNITFKKP